MPSKRTTETRRGRGALAPKESPERGHNEPRVRALETNHGIPIEGGAKESPERGHLALETNHGKPIEGGAPSLRRNPRNEGTTNRRFAPSKPNHGNPIEGGAPSLQAHRGRGALAPRSSALAPRSPALELRSRGSLPHDGMVGAPARKAVESLIAGNAVMQQRALV